MLNISDNVLNPWANSYRQDLASRVAEAAQDPGTSVYGGLHYPTAIVETANGPTPWAAEIGLGEALHLVSVLRGASYVLVAALTAMRDSEIQALSCDSATSSDGIPALRSIQYKGIDGEVGRDRVWYAPAPVIEVVRLLSELSPSQEMLFARSQAPRSSYAPERDVPRFIDYVNSDAVQRPGGGAELALSRIDANRGRITQMTLRRSFAVFAARYPEAELGLGIQLGQAALRMTAGYYLDSQEQAVRLMDDDRRKAANDLTRSLVHAHSPLAGAGSEEVSRLRSMVVSDPTRAERLVSGLADRYHLGILNDCHYRAELAQCGDDGPHLAEHRCSTYRCPNAVITERHAAVWRKQMSRLDGMLERDHIHPVLRKQLGADRAEIHSVLVTLRTKPKESA